MKFFRLWLARKILNKEVRHILAASKHAEAWSPTMDCILCKEQIVLDADYCAYCGVWQEDGNLPPLVQVAQTQPLHAQGTGPIVLARVLPLEPTPLEDRETQRVLWSARDRAKLKDAREGRVRER